MILLILVILMLLKGKGKGAVLDIVLLTRWHMPRSVIQSWKWQLIGMS